MRITKTIMVEKEITTCSCDVCGKSTDTNSGCCGFAPIMDCYFCGQDCCKDHRRSYWENEWEDYCDMTICSDCLPKGDQAWNIALDIAGRNDDIVEIAKKVFEKFEEYKHMIGDE